MLKLSIAIAFLLSVGTAMAEDHPAAPGQSVTGPASERTTGSAAADTSRNKAARPSTNQQAEKPNGVNGGENGTSREEAPGVNSSTTNSY